MGNAENDRKIGDVGVCVCVWENHSEEPASDRPGWALLTASSDTGKKEHFCLNVEQMFLLVFYGVWELTCHKKWLGVPELWAHTGKPVDTPKLATQKKWGSLGEDIKNQFVIGNYKRIFFLLFRYTEYFQTGVPTFFFFFFEMCNCVKLHFRHNRNFKPSCFYPTNSNWRTSSLSWEHIWHQETTFLTHNSTSIWDPSELTNCVEAKHMPVMYSFYPGLTLAFTVLGIWEI